MPKLHAEIKEQQRACDELEKNLKPDWMLTNKESDERKRKILIDSMMDDNDYPTDLPF